MSQPTTIEMFFDASCPWCHGAIETSRRLLDELAADPAMPPFEVRWRFMRLHPMPREGGLSVDEFMSAWAADADALERSHQAVQDYATSVGVRVDRTRYTYLHDPFTAHRLLAAVRDDGGDDAPCLWSLARVVAAANFAQGVDISDLAALRGAVERGGLAVPQRIWQLLADDGHAAETLADHARALEVQLDGVPRMVIGKAIVPTWVDHDAVRASLRSALVQAAGATTA